MEIEGSIPLEFASEILTVRVPSEDVSSFEQQARINRASKATTSVKYKEKCFGFMVIDSLSPSRRIVIPLFY
jgi:hypothetical protein